MGQMLAQHQDMSQLMSKMMQSMTAINNEKDPVEPNHLRHRSERLGYPARKADFGGRRG